MTENPLESRQVRILFGLISGFAIALIGFLFFEGVALLLVLGLAVIEAVAVPYFLEIAIETDEAE